MTRQNGISIEEMLDLEIMNKCKLIAGFRGIRNTVSRVNIAADPDIFDWVQPGEFLLTTAYFFKKDDIEGQKRWIREASQKHLSGIGIKISPYLDCLPQEVLNYADELNFPIVDIHYSLPLSDVMIEILKEIFNKQASLLERIEKVHEEFIEVILEGKSIREVVEIVSGYIKNPVVLALNLSNKTFNQLNNVSDDIKEELLKDVKRFYTARDSKSRNKKLYEDKVIINGKFVDRMVMPIIVKDDVYGHLFTWSVNAPLGGFDLSIIDSAATIISLSVLQELNIREVEIRHRSEFFEDLISIDLKRRRKALEKAPIFDLALGNYCVVEVLSLKLRFEEKNEKREAYLINRVKDHINAAVSIIEEIMNYLNLKGIISTRLNGIQILIQFEDKEIIKNKLDDFNNRIISTLETKFPHMDIRIGVGRVYEGLEKANKSFSDAVRAIRTGKKLTNKKIITFDELGIFKILAQDTLANELEDFYKATLKKLEDYDNKKSTELLKTLEAYFMFNGNLSKISEHLYTHYNTVLYRINRIEEITGMRLDNPNDRLNLEIALKIRQLL
ncbi:PucR family transcriptional regulator [Caldanaerobacter subterraneus]|uniref:PucR family transcriptional regulator n=1 Tax=Caldanaerobacter subterraneus TaxID=911092 RepID=UPI003463BADA